MRGASRSRPRSSSPAMPPCFAASPISSLPDGARAPLVLAEPFAVGAVLRRSAPRILRDGIGPIVVFFIGWKLVGLVAGIALATAFAVLMYRRERRHGRPALVVRVALGLVLVRATVGLISGDAKVY